MTDLTSTITVDITDDIDGDIAGGGGGGASGFRILTETGGSFITENGKHMVQE